MKRKENIILLSIFAIILSIFIYTKFFKLATLCIEFKSITSQIHMYEQLSDSNLNKIYTELSEKIENKAAINSQVITDLFNKHGYTYEMEYIKDSQNQSFITNMDKFTMVIYLDNKNHAIYSLQYDEKSKYGIDLQYTCYNNEQSMQLFKTCKNKTKRTELQDKLKKEGTDSYYLR